MNARFFYKTLSVMAALFLTCAMLRAESASDLIRKGDVFDQKFQATEALQFYLPAEKLEPKDVRILVRIARQYRHLMTDAATKEEKLRLGGLALEYSQRAAALAPNDSEAQIAIGITYGKMLAFASNKEKSEATPRIKASADLAIALDPRNDTAWHVLGRWHRVLADVGTVKRALAQVIYGKLPTTTNEAAVVCFEKAIAINPNRLMHYIELGLTYAQMGRKEDARRFLTKGIAMPDVEKDDPAIKQRGREALEKL